MTPSKLLIYKIKLSVQALSTFTHMTDMIPHIRHDGNFLDQVLRRLSITVTQMYRDPTFYLALRKEVLPALRTLPALKIWHAGCATGEEVYSLAILLKEEGLYDRALLVPRSIQ